MDFHHLILDQSFQDSESIALIKINRPEKLNALHNPTMREITQALEICEQSEKIKVIMITGDKKAFAAGADLKQLSQSCVTDQLKNPRPGYWKKISSTSKPLIAVVDGYALGAGCELAMSCDFILASDKAVFGQPELNVGTIPGGGGTQRLTKSLGKSKAMFHILTGELITADVALKYDLVAKVFPQDCLMQEAFLIAKKISTQPIFSTKLAKESINYSFESHLSSGLEFERRNFNLTFATQDQKEGALAFLEKRKPEYQGN